MERLSVSLAGGSATTGLAAELAAGGLTIVEDGETAEVRVVASDAPSVIAAAADGDRRVVALVAGADRRTVRALLGAGAAGVVVEGTPAPDVARAIAAVAAGFLVVPPTAGRALRTPMLTARQQQILGLVVLGLRNGQIAARLHVTESTIKTHLRAVYSELGVRSRREAVDLVLDPDSALDAGVLGMASRPRRKDGYSTPIVKR